jgi:TRAP-type mannitol/chloroaromatic compound transport system permease small subunit
MRLDIRWPIGLMFAILGALLAVYGGVTLGQPGTAPGGVPINLYWGLVMLAFGLLMLAGASKGKKEG